MGIVEEALVPAGLGVGETFEEDEAEFGEDGAILGKVFEEGAEGVGMRGGVVDNGEEGLFGGGLFLLGEVR